MATALLPTAADVAQIERLIKISIEKPINPQTFIPWADRPADDQIFMPPTFVSLHGHPLFDRLSDGQKRELGRLEMIQVMYSYAWSECLATLFFNRFMLDLMPSDPVHRFLARECIEEFQHQEMFARAISSIGGEPLRPSFLHRFLGKMTARFFPADAVFMSVLAVEMIADAYGKAIRKDENVFSVLRKSSELHHIEEGRHIHFTRILLRNMTKNAGPLRRTWLTTVVMLNIWFMRTLYVRREFFEKIGAPDPSLFHREAQKNFKKNFAQNCLDDAIEFVEKDLGGFNFLTRRLWRWTLAAAV